MKIEGKGRSVQLDNGDGFEVQDAEDIELRDGVLFITNRRSLRIHSDWASVNVTRVPDATEPPK